jgi:hypothetical protein
MGLFWLSGVSGQLSRAVEVVTAAISTLSEFFKVRRKFVGTFAVQSARRAGHTSCDRFGGQYGFRQ